MAVQVKPNIKEPNIEIQFDKKSQTEVDRILNEWPTSIPLVKIGDYVLQIGDVISCSVNFSINKLPVFNLTITDQFFKIREALKSEIDKIVIVFGYRNWTVKIAGLITQINSDSINNNFLYLSGIAFYNEKLYECEQKVYVDKTIAEILKEICTECDLGLFTYDNETLSTFKFEDSHKSKNNRIINPGLRRIDFITELIEKYTDNIWMLDSLGYLHVGDIETILKSPIDKYSIDYKTGESISETDLIFTTNRTTEYEEKKIYVDSLTIDSNFSLSYLHTHKNYKVLDEQKKERKLKTYEKYGIGDILHNTFSDWLEHKNPEYRQRVNKLLLGNLIKLNLRNIIYEIIPFTLVGLELYLDYNAEDNKPVRLDEEHSGKHMVIGYSYNYQKPDDDSASYVSQELQII